MKRKSSIMAFTAMVLFVLGLFTGCGADATSPYEVAVLEPSNEQYKPQWDESSVQAETLGYIVDTILIQNNFRGVVLVTQNGDTVLRTAYGNACDIQDIENTVYSPFRLASISKQFTGAAILLLEQEGALDRMDTIDNFFAGHEGLSYVTIAHLLAMKGGFYDYSNLFFELVATGELDNALSISAAEIESHIISNWGGALLTQPKYCNSAYWLLGRIVEQVSGMAYEEFIESRLFTPIGMTNSGFSGIHESVMPHSFPVFYVDGQNIMDVTIWPFIFTYSTGGLISTIDDLSMWLDAYFGGQLFPEYLLDSVYAGDYNYGWAFTNNTIWHHSGNQLGFRAYIIFDRDTGSRVILLSNEDKSGFENLVSAVSYAVFDIPIGSLGIPIGS